MGLTALREKKYMYTDKTKLTQMVGPLTFLNECRFVSLDINVSSRAAGFVAVSSTEETDSPTSWMPLGKQIDITFSFFGELSL